MIDTIVLVLDNNSYQISQPDKFEPSAHWALATNSYQSFGMQSKQNPTKQELKRGIYKPRLTLAHRFNLVGKREIMLKIELSLPKLLFGNNFDELKYKDFQAICTKLVLVLATMGVATTTDILAQAPVFTIHYAKNIALTDGSTPYHYINKIKEANVKLALDVNQTDYRNEGHSYKWHANAYEVVFYDKIKALEKAKKSSKRALEKDNELQLNLFPDLQKRHKLELLRIEVRLNKRQKIKQLFNKLGIAADLTFKKLFKPAISKKILLHYLDEIESKRPLLLDYKTTNNKALLVDLIFNNPTIGPKQIFQIYGLKQALDIMNPRELRSLFSHNQRSWYRLMVDINKVKLPTKHKSFGIIREQLMKFKSLNISSYI